MLYMWKISMHLPDINLWLALTFEAHVHHRCASEWFAQTESKSSFFCRFTQKGFLRLATNQAVFGNEALTMNRAWTCYDQLLKDERVEFCEEPAEIENAWRKLTQQKRHSHRVWSDAYLAAFAKTARLEIVTFDKGFSSHRELRVIVLED